jgi:formyltetrahydrofolate-dependent phosphoribosylglycinamide formyltransferase
MTEPVATAVLISGRGSNMRALVAAAERPGFPAAIRLVVSNVAGAGGLDHAAAAGIPTATLASKGRTREAFEAELDATLRAAGIGLVCLAGFMRILMPGFVRAWAGRMINIHPSLLPAYPGLETHARALVDGVSVHGCTVHWVTPELDAGPAIVQARVPVLPGDTEESLAARVLEMEHRAYPLALERVAAGRAGPGTAPILLDHPALAVTAT